MTNKNVLVVGGSGSGKTRFFIKPNIMQCTKTKGTSIVVTDPKSYDDSGQTEKPAAEGLRKPEKSWLFGIEGRWFVNAENCRPTENYRLV